jgi:hypothetical protein
MNHGMEDSDRIQWILSRKIKEIREKEKEINDHFVGSMSLIFAELIKDIVTCRN